MAENSGLQRLMQLADLVSPMAVRVAATLRLADHIAAGATTSADRTSIGHQRHVPVTEPLTLDQDLGAGDQHDAVLPQFTVEISGSPDGPLAAAAVAEAIVALQLLADTRGAVLAFTMRLHILAFGRLVATFSQPAA